MQAIIIAAGESSRFWPFNYDNTHKSQISVLGRPLLYWTIKGLVANGVKDIVIVRRPHADLANSLPEEELGAKITYVVQEKPLGSGNAIALAREYITGQFFVLWPNKVNSKELVRQMLFEQRKMSAEAVFVGAPTETPWEYGVFRLTEDSIVQEIVENPEKGKEPSDIKVLGAYLLQQDFFKSYDDVGNKHEADFVEALNMYMSKKKTALVRVPVDAPTLKHPWDLFHFLEMLSSSGYFQKKKERNVRIGRNVTIEGDVHIGENAVIKDNTIIQGPCYIGENVEIGHSNVLRGPVNLEAEVKTGAFMEIKNSIVQRGTHFHSGYIGDSVVGEECRFGAGFITANRRLDRRDIQCHVKGERVSTGRSHLGAMIGKGSAFGIHSGTMPGVMIGAESVIGPGHHIFKNLPEKSEHIARPT